MTADLQPADTMEQSTQTRFKEAGSASSSGPISKLAARLKSVFSRSGKTAGKAKEPAKTKLGFREKIKLLTFSQWCYLLAFTWLIFGYDEAESGTGPLVAVGLITAVGLIRELWMVFSIVWNNALGKGVIVVLYAATANFALAVSALKINEITGVEPTPFYFTMAFTTLLMLPFWIGLASLVFLSLTLVIGNLWLLLSVLVRVLGIRLRVHWEDQSFVFLTMILRIILIPILLFTLAMLLSPYFKQLDMFDSKIPSNFVAEFEQAKVVKVDPANRQTVDEVLTTLEQQGVPIPVEQKQALDEALAQQSEAEQNAEPSEEPVDTEEPATPGFLDRLVAGFIYNFETYPYSQCYKQQGQRTLVIDENLTFIAQRTDDKLGYQFSVGPCTPRYEVPITE